MGVCQPQHCHELEHGPIQPPRGPTVLRIVLGARLRRLREARGITREAAGEAIRASHAKISRLELGRVGFKTRDMTDLLTLYDVTDQHERETFLRLAQHANEPSWWRDYGDALSSWFETYLGLEQASSVIRTYEVQFVPGLLQTEDNARAIIELCQVHASAREIDRRVALRMARQDFLAQPEAPDYWAVVDEAALRRPWGTPQARRAQLHHLIEIAELPNITLQVVPFSAGTHLAAGGPFTILHFNEPDITDIVYLEQLTSAVYLDKKRDTDNYLTIMNQLRVKAYSTTDTITFLSQISKEM
ncbi:MAG: helix-turn-helix domain-containing protein [Pseudonocardiaceae bacterium]